MAIHTFSNENFYSEAKNWYSPLLGTVIDEVIVDGESHFIANFLPVSGMKMVIRDLSRRRTYGTPDAVYFCTDWDSSTNTPINKIPTISGDTTFSSNYLFKNNSGSIYGFLYNHRSSGLGFNMLFNVGNDWYLLTSGTYASPYHYLIKVSYPYESYSLIGLAVDADYLSPNGKYYKTPLYLTKAGQIISTVPNIYCITKKLTETTHVVGDNYILLTPFQYNFEGLKSWLLIDLSS